MNKSFTEGIFPVELKLARVVPIFKAGDPTQIANYRPISVLTFVFKVFEKIMYNCILKFMDANHVFYEHQYGFRHKHSIQQAIITLVDKITNWLDKGDIIISVFLDLKKKHLILLTIIYYLRSYMHKVYVETLANGLNIIYAIGLSTLFTIINNL